MSLGIPDSFAETHLDQRGLEADGLTRDKIEDTRSIKALVVSFDPITHSAMVRPLAAGYGDLIRVKIKTHYKGPVAGAGKGAAVYPGDSVDIEFSGGIAYGLYGQGQVSGSVFIKQEPGSAVLGFAPWQQSGTGTVDVRADSSGRLVSAEHKAAESSYFEAGAKSYDKHSNESETVVGENITRAEEQLREAANVIGLAAKLLSQEVSA